MDSTYVCDGQQMSYVAGADISAGDILVIGQIVAHSPRDIANGDTGSVTIEGVVSFPKATGSSTALAQGVKVYWNAGGGVVTTTSSSHKVAGYVFKAALDADAFVEVKLARV